MQDAQENVQVETQQTEQTQVSTEQQQTEQVQQTEAAVQPEGQEQEQQQTEQQSQERDANGRFKGVQTRIDELTRARRESEREAAYWRQVAQGSQSSAQAAPQRPAPEQFAKYDDYVDALVKYETAEAVSRHLQANSARQVAQTRAETFMERQNQFRQQAKDYDEVVGASSTPLANHVAEVLQESDLGPQLAYHFAKNPDVLMQLNGMSPTAAAREIGRLEGKLSQPTAAPATPAKKVSNTPAPAGTQSTSGRSSTKPIGEMSMEDYMAARKAQGARWAR